MRSLQPSPSYLCLIHFPSNNPGALWFICLWSLLTLTNTFRFSPLLRSLLAELLGAVGNNNYFFLAWSQSFASSRGTTLRQAKGNFCFSGFIRSLPKPAKTKNFIPQSSLAYGQYSTTCKLRVKSKKIHRGAVTKASQSVFLHVPLPLVSSTFQSQYRFLSQLKSASQCCDSLFVQLKLTQSNCSSSHNSVWFKSYIPSWQRW